VIAAPYAVAPQPAARRAAPLTIAALAFGFAAIPAYPAFITLSTIHTPGVSLIPRAVAIALLAVCAVAASIVTIDAVRDPLPLPATFVPVCAYIGGWLVTALLGFDPATGLLFVADGLLVLAFHLGIARNYADPRAAVTMLTAFLASGAAVSLLALAMVVLRRPALIYAFGHGRATGTFVVPGELAGYLLFLIPIAAGVALVSRRRWLRLLAWCAAGAGLVALAATFSRAGWLGFVVGGSFFVFMQRRSLLLGLVLAAALAVGLVTISVYNGHHNPSENYTRLSIWRTGLRAVQLFPVTGVGPGSFRHVYPSLRPPDGEPTAFHAHDYVLTSFAETGLVGMTTLIALWWSFGRAAGGALHGADRRARTLALAVLSGFVATWAQGALDFIQVVVLGCWIPFMALAIGAARYGLGEP
jgi:O-antigen ligase